MARKNHKEGLKLILNEYGNKLAENIENAAQSKNYFRASVWQESEKLYFEVRKKIHDLVGGFDEVKHDK